MLLRTDHDKKARPRAGRRIISGVVENTPNRRSVWRIEMNGPLTAGSTVPRDRDQATESTKTDGQVRRTGDRHYPPNHLSSLDPGEKPTFSTRLKYRTSHLMAAQIGKSTM